MSNHAAPRTTARTYTAPEPHPSPLGAFAVTVAVLIGGMFAGHAWLVDTCPTTHDARTATVCAAVLR